jgi:hypothetical protein
MAIIMIDPAVLTSFPREVRPLTAGKPRSLKFVIPLVRILFRIDYDNVSKFSQRKVNQGVFTILSNPYLEYAVKVTT